MPSLQNLVGSQKNSSDIRSIPYKLRYLNATEIGPDVSNGPVRFTLPRQNSGFLDLSTLRFKGLLNVTTSDPSARLAGHDASVLLNRIRVTNGSSVIFDQEFNPLLSNFCNGLVSATELDYISYCRALSDYPTLSDRSDQVLTSHTANRILVFPLGPTSLCLLLRNFSLLGTKLLILIKSQ